MAEKPRYLQRKKDCFSVLVGRQVIVCILLLLYLLLACFFDAQAIGALWAERMGEDDVPYTLLLPADGKDG